MTRNCARPLGVLLILLFVALAAPGQASAQEEAPPEAQQANKSGGATFNEEPVVVPQVTVPGRKAVMLESGYAAAPEEAPDAVKKAIWAANLLQHKPYVYGGGHGDFDDDGYDCSGTVSFALNGAGVLRKPRDSSGFMRYGKSGKGRWITIYTNPGHAYMVIAGLRLDTSQAGSTGGDGPRWRPGKARPTRGYTVRHPAGL